MSLKNLKVGDTVIMVGFTGMKLGRFTVSKASDKSVTITKTNGDKAIFSKKTGKQTNVAEGKEKYANKIEEDDGSYKNPLDGKKGKKKAAKKSSGKKSKKKKDPEEDVEEMAESDGDDEDER